MEEEPSVTIIGENNNTIVRMDESTAAHILKKRKVKGDSKKVKLDMELRIFHIRKIYGKLMN
ncbi:12463_t:CDS:2 [Entrophospora sp. SA101]|nr:12463_t:CDS:2 [Entrophospora sp. SA101]